MASSILNNGSLATFVIKVNGNTIPDTTQVLSASIQKNVNRISTAKMVVVDGDPSTGNFDVSSSDIFVPGAELSIEGGYDSINTLLFKGIITGQSIRIDGQVGSVLEIECRDAAVKMTVGRKSQSFSKRTDGNIISSIIAQYGLSANVASTQITWPEQLQYYVTDWDFILARAEANGLIVTTINGKVSVSKPDADTTSVLAVKYGDSLIEFNARLDAISQFKNVKASSWDFESQAVVSSEASTTYAGPGNLSTAKLSSVIGLKEYELQSTAPLQASELSTWAAAQMTKSEYSKIQGCAKLQGTGLVEPAKYLTLEGVGSRFNGDHFISGVEHQFSEGNWFTEVTLGLSNTWFTEQPDVMAPPASGLLPGARGLLNGTVRKISEDPDSQFRILVDIPMFDTNGSGIWARLSNFYSSNGAGAFFLPEIGDEVILGFLNEDPRFPVILGSMYSKPKAMPFAGLEPNEKNSIKAIVTKSGLSVQFDDENKVFTIVTPDKNTLVLNDRDKQITLKDTNQNSITMSSEGISIRSTKNINIEADQGINIKGTQMVNVQSAGGDVNVSAMNIRESADMQFSAQGNATAKVSGGMELTLKGAMVMIN